LKGGNTAKERNQQFDAEGFSLVNVISASKAPVHWANMPFGCADTYLGGEERSDSWAGGALQGHAGPGTTPRCALQPPALLPASFEESDKPPGLTWPALEWTGYKLLLAQEDGGCLA
jgi:hypothetical protein